MVGNLPQHDPRLNRSQRRPKRGHEIRRIVRGPHEQLRRRLGRLLRGKVQVGAGLVGQRRTPDVADDADDGGVVTSELDLAADGVLTVEELLLDGFADDDHCGAGGVSGRRRVVPLGAESAAHGSIRRWRSASPLPAVARLRAWSFRPLEAHRPVVSRQWRHRGGSPAACTPGRLRTASTARDRSRRARRFRSDPRAPNLERQHAGDRESGVHRSSFAKLRKISPAPVSKTSASAISTTTSVDVARRAARLDDTRPGDINESSTVDADPKRPSTG